MIKAKLRVPRPCTKKYVCVRVPNGEEPRPPDRDHDWSVEALTGDANGTLIMWSRRQARSEEYWSSLDDELFTVGPYSSREEAVAEAAKEFDMPKGTKFYTCIAIPETCSYGPTAEDIVDSAKCFAEDNGCPEHMDWLGSVPPAWLEQLQVKIDKAWDKWLASHDLTPSWFQADEVVEHTYEG
jgi:hypothetical protein